MSPGAGETLSQPVARSLADRSERTRRGFIGALLAAAASALAIALVWILARGAPSAGRDPAWDWPPASTSEEASSS